TPVRVRMRRRSSARPMHDCASGVCSVGLRPDGALRTGLPRERTRAGLAFVERQAADRDAEIVLDLLLELDLAREVRQRETAVYRRRRALLDLLRREERVELVAIVDLSRVRDAKRTRALEQRALNLGERGRDRRDELGARNGGLLLRTFVSAADEDGVLLDIARTDLEPQRNALAHPAPDLLATALVALVDDDANGGPGELLR